jgi:ParB-like chromosome segregation protein Spo0J
LRLEPGNFGGVERKGGNQACLARNRKDLGEIVTVPIASLRPGESPRLNGQDKAHIMRLAELETALPPILVDRKSMKVIDGMHRLMVASLKGCETVEVLFFDGSAADAFLWAVKENVAHGLPLSLADRRAATARIILSHQELSDRALGELVGLAARTVASIRRSVANGTSPSDRRVGRDGKVRPLSGVEGRQRVADLLAEQPDASSRVLARRAGVSPATVRDVRQRLARGEAPARSMRGPRGTPADDNAANTLVGKGGPVRKTGGTDHTAGQEVAAGQQARASYPPSLAADSPDSMLRAASATALEKLLRDPSLRHSEPGRYLLRLLQLNAAGEQEWPRVLTALPPHCLATVVVLARQYGEMWLGFAQELDERARILDPWAGDGLGCLAGGS